MSAGEAPAACDPVLWECSPSLPVFSHVRRLWHVAVSAGRRFLGYSAEDAHGVPTTVIPAQPATAPADKAGTWQRIVLGLAGLLLLLSWLGGVSSLAGLSFFGAVLFLVAVGFGYAAVRPPGGIFRRLLVTAACLVILLAAGVVIAAIVLFTWLSDIR